LAVIKPSINRHRQRADGSPHCRRIPSQLSGPEPKVTLSIDDRSKSNRQTEASHPAPHASVRSRAEGDVMIRATGQVETIGLAELLRVAIRSA
jgi:hypothetical protein